MHCILAHYEKLTLEQSPPALLLLLKGLTSFPDLLGLCSSAMIGLSCSDVMKVWQGMQDFQSACTGDIADCIQGEYLLNGAWFLGLFNLHVSLIGLPVENHQAGFTTAFSFDPCRLTSFIFQLILYLCSST